MGKKGDKRLDNALRYLRRAQELVTDASYDGSPKDGHLEVIRSLNEAMRDLSRLMGAR